MPEPALQDAVREAADTPRKLGKPTTLPRALYRAAQVIEFDRIAMENYDLSSDELMARAGRAALETLQQRWPHARRLLILAGTGNNAGDGFVVARLALEAGLLVSVMQFGNPGQMRGAALSAVKSYLDANGEVQSYQGELPGDVDVIVDAMFGVGLDRAVKDLWAKGIIAANSHFAPILALDVPSGLHSDTGVIMGEAIHADATICFIGLKQGLYTADGPDCAGEVLFSALELPARIYSSEILAARRLSWGRHVQGLPPRPRNCHKTQFGRTLVIGGERGMAGAARMAAEAAMRCGAGMVTVATRLEHADSIIAGRPELMSVGVNKVEQLRGLLEDASVVVIGPGLGQSNWAKSALRTAIAAKLPMVLDADALNLLAQFETIGGDENWILTPHVGEAARLLKCNSATIQRNRFAAARQIASRYGGHCVLKGAGTIVQGSGSRPPAVCTAGNPGMATAGMGDVLSGVLGALLAQHMTPQEAAEFGVCLHGAAADVAVQEGGERGLMAGDLFAPLRQLINSV